MIIQWILDEYIFGKSYPMGITDEHIRVLEEVEEGMGNGTWGDRPAEG